MTPFSKAFAMSEFISSRMKMIKRKQKMMLKSKIDSINMNKKYKKLLEIFEIDWLENVQPIIIENTIDYYDNRMTANNFIIDMTCYLKILMKGIISTSKPPRY